MFTAWLTALHSVALYPPPRLRFTTLAPCCAAHRMPLATATSVPDPLLFRTFTGIKDELNATPATPVPLFVIAAMLPATCVPCP